MSMTLSGNGTITGLVSGGLPDGTVLPADLSTGGPSWDTSSNLQFNSGYGSAATAYGCRAWVNFNGAGTVAIRASGNVSSITDNGTGDYTVNLTTAMPDANYSVVGLSSSTAVSVVGTMSIYSYGGITAYTTSSIRVRTSGNSSALVAEDATYANISIFR